jgi:hypothetical protein
MSGMFTRRNMLGISALTAGSFAASSCTLKKIHETDQSTKPHRGYGPNKDLVRDLAPGATPIRLGGFLGSLLANRGKTGPAESVKKLADDGFRGCHCDADIIHKLKDSELKELNAALKQYDVAVFEVGGY